MGVSAAVALIFLAVLDYLYQKFDYEKIFACQNRTSKTNTKKPKAIL